MRRMNRRYVAPKLTKYSSPADLPEHLRNLLLLEPSDLHEVLNLLQVITSQCDIIEESADNHGRVKAIREAALKISERLRDWKKIA